jgi:acetoin utilization deacetylase AcuC-like enzyme
MKCSYHPGYQVTLPPQHPFPMSKFPLLKDQLLAEGILSPDDLMEPAPLDIDTLAVGDRYGKLALTEEGIRLRDREVIAAVRGRGIPLVVVLAGGYAATRERTAELHAHVFREAVA